jgi:NAD-dependent dihydropyrimidine dehydrogenase PreA subunit
MIWKWKMTYKTANIYYYSGTGNSYRVGQWISEAARENNIEAILQPISGLLPATSEAPSGSQTLAAFVFPTHGFTTPWPVIRFALRLPRRPGTHALVCATRGGTKLGRLFVPGMEGTAAWLMAFLLWLKGYRIRGVQGVNMPANWIAVHPAYREQSARQIIDHAQPGALDSIQQVLAGQRQLRGWVPLLLGLGLLPLSLGYLLVGRFFLAKLLYASDSCNGCGLCARRCPSQAIRMTGKDHSRPYWTFSCHSCMRCMNLCPQQAIEANYPLAVGMVYLGNLPVGILLLRGVATITGTGWVAQSVLIQYLFHYGYALAAIAFLYGIFHLLVGMKWFNRLITTLTPTHYYPRYHEPDTDLKDI